MPRFMACNWQAREHEYFDEATEYDLEILLLLITVYRVSIVYINSELSFSGEILNNNALPQARPHLSLDASLGRLIKLLNLS
jgi:hypothetical protein